MVNLLPAWQTTADMIPDEVGQWMFHCHVNDHIKAGMMAIYTVDGMSQRTGDRNRVIELASSTFSVAI